MFSASEARQRADALKAERHEAQKHRAEKAINEAVENCGYSCRLDFTPTEETFLWLKSLGYKVDYQTGGKYIVTW